MSPDQMISDEAYWVPDPGYQHVRGVMVMSADGAAQVAGRSNGLSSPSDKALFALLRSHADAVFVGAGTARTERYGGDRPAPDRAAWRAAHGLAPAPRVAVVSGTCELDPEGPLFSDTLVPPVVVTCEAAPRDRRRALAGRADVVLAGTDRVDVAQALDQLAGLGLRRVSCEGGPRLLAQVAACGRLDELSLTVAPLLVGGAADRILSGPELAPAAGLELIGVLTREGNVFLRYARRRG